MDASHPSFKNSLEKRALRQTLARLALASRELSKAYKQEIKNSQKIHANYFRKHSHNIIEAIDDVLSYQIAINYHKKQNKSKLEDSKIEFAKRKQRNALNKFAKFDQQAKEQNFKLTSAPVFKLPIHKDRLELLKVILSKNSDNIKHQSISTIAKKWFNKIQNATVKNYAENNREINRDDVQLIIKGSSNTNFNLGRLRFNINF